MMPGPAVARPYPGAVCVETAASSHAPLAQETVLGLRKRARRNRAHPAELTDVAAWLPQTISALMGVPVPANVESGLLGCRQHARRGGGLFR